MRPENREGPAANGAVLQNHQRDTSDSTAQQVLDAEICAGALGVLLVVPRRRAVELLADVDADVFLDPGHRFALSAIRDALELYPGVDPDPVVVASAIRRRNLSPPPAWRGQPLSELHSLASSAPPAATAGWYWDQVRENATRRAVANVGQSLAARAWLGDSGELAEALEHQIAALVQLRERVRK